VASVFVNQQGMLTMIDILHHGATNGVTGSCHELTLTPGMKKGSDPAGSDPRFAADSRSAGMRLKTGADPAGSDPRFAADSGSAGMLLNKGSDPVGSDPNFMPSRSAGILIDCGLFQGQDQSRGASASDLSIDFPIGHIRALVVTHVHIDHVGRRRSRPGTDEKIKMLLATESTEGHGKIKAEERRRKDRRIKSSF